MKQNRIAGDMETKLKRIAWLSRENPKKEFNGLMPHFNKEFLMSCFNELDRNKAVGVDGKSKDDYAKDLETNIEDLVHRMKEMAYKPRPVRQVLIPKDNGKTRPLGISTIEDKIVQLMFSKILEAIYEPLFVNESFGFRRGRSCHDAVREVNDRLYPGRTDAIVDLDLQNFFGTIDHGKLVALLEMKIKDKNFVRYIVRMLKSGMLADGELKKSDEGTPQGSICSPILANIFAHYAIDLWFEEQVVPRCSAGTFMVRYCDDLVIGCSKPDAQRILKSLGRRLERFSLELNKEKTKVVNFSRFENRKSESFDFLGFTFYKGRSSRGFLITKLKTSGKRLRAKLRNVKTWCKSNRHKGKLLSLWKVFVSKLRGHIRYYGVSHNNRRVSRFIQAATRIFFKWMNRRSQKRSLNWNQFRLFIEKYPLPKVLIYHRLF